MTQRPISYGRQNITQEDIDQVTETLKSDFLTQGPKIKAFEDAFANYVGSSYAVAVANGTAALHLCALAINLKPGQKVITTPITFAASANCVRYCGGEVVFADIDPVTYLLDINKVRELIQSSPRGTYAGIIPVDFAGRAVDLEAFRTVADENNLWIIEDACHAPGGYFTDRKGQQQNCGNGKLADLAIFSFHPVKHIACGEGGMITTNNEQLYNKLLLLRTHGITRDSTLFSNDVNFAIGNSRGAETNSKQLTNNSYPGWYMEMQELGFNYRLTDFQAALGLSQLQRAHDGIERRKIIASRYAAQLQHPKIIRQTGLVEGHAYHLYVIEVQNRLGLYNFLRANFIFAQVHYIPVHRMPYYAQFGWKQGDFPDAENYYEGCLSLPMYPTLSDQEQDFVIQKVMQFLNE